MPSSLGHRGPARLNDLDGKVIQIFSAGSVVVGLAGVSGIDKTTKPIVIGLLADAVFSYAVVAGLAIWQLFAKRVQVARYGDRLWTNYWNDSVQSIKHALVAIIERAYRHNKRVLRNKALTTKLTLLTAGIEVGLVALALVAARLP